MAAPHAGVMLERIAAQIAAPLSGDGTMAAVPQP